MKGQEYLDHLDKLATDLFEETLTYSDLCAKKEVKKIMLDYALARHLAEAYANGLIEGKNAEMRKIEIDAIVSAFMSSGEMQAPIMEVESDIRKSRYRIMFKRRLLENARLVIGMQKHE